MIKSVFCPVCGGHHTAHEPSEGRFEFPCHSGKEGDRFGEKHYDVVVTITNVKDSEHTE